MMLRRIEYHPSAAPQTLAAIRTLERARQRHATSMLVESRALLETQEKLGLQPEKRVGQPKEVKPAEPEAMFAPSLPLSAISAPPPISKVLHDVYADETRAQ
ncbi:MAG TPA: hypothetical protein VM656_07210 [Pyrinomonadaceae bacterium]|nr:hypothetical protein [Pyrinomonadaceae bacterium]